MNQATSLKLASFFTGIVAILTVIQPMLTTPPFGPNFIVTASAVITFVVMALTVWKQYLSPEVSNSATRITLIAAIIATLAGGLELAGVFNVAESTAVWIRWGVSIVTMVLNIYSKGLFPSQFQKDKMQELRQQS